MLGTNAERGEGTRSVRAGRPQPGIGEPSLPGPVFASHFHAPGELTGNYTYGRNGHPNWTLLENAFSELEAPNEKVQSVVFPSGMASISAVLMSTLRPGNVVVLPSDGFQNLPLAQAWLEANGVIVRLAPTVDDFPVDQLDDADMLWIESPSNPWLNVCDIERLTRAAHERGALVAVDNSLATPLGQRPLLLGADISVCSVTKSLSGHGDLFLGYVTCRDNGLADALRLWRKTSGAIPGPMEVWLAHRSLATLQLRLERQCANALAVAQLLVDMDDVTSVRYPGLSCDPSYSTASRQMKSFGPMVAFVLPDKAYAERFLGSLKLVGEATGFGGVESTAERRGRWGVDVVPEGFIRFSAGIEDTDDLVRDIVEALAAARLSR